MKSSLVLHTEFAAQLRRVGVTQVAFASLCGVTAIAVNHWCRGRRQVPAWAWALVRALDHLTVEVVSSPPKLQWWETLGVSPVATPDRISVARRRLAAKYHPDIGGCVEAMKRINLAAEAASPRRS